MCPHRPRQPPAQAPDVLLRFVLYGELPAPKLLRAARAAGGRGAAALPQAAGMGVALELQVAAGGDAGGGDGSS
jgi:hypothetical protein